MSALITVVGNPKPNSRTREVAELLATRIAEVTGTLIDDTVELAEVAGELFTFPSEQIDAHLERLANSRIAIIATPTYKASYTGLLKSFLDRLPADGLQGVTAIPVFTIGSPAHQLAVEVTLRPLLVELGASVPTRGLAFPTSQFDEREQVLDAWVEGQASSLIPTPVGAAR